MSSTSIFSAVTQIFESKGKKLFLELYIEENTLGGQDKEDGFLRYSFPDFL